MKDLGTLGDKVEIFVMDEEYENEEVVFTSNGMKKPLRLMKLLYVNHIFLKKRKNAVA